MTLNGIQAIGNLLQYFHSDLNYILEFHKYKTGNYDLKNYLKKKPGTFKTFINEFKIARNIDKTKTSELFQETLKWIKKEDPHDIDSFADYLKTKNLTHGKKVTSLASKILFLNDPWRILPIDRLTRQAVGLSDNNYSKYIILVNHFRDREKTEIRNCLNSVDQHLRLVENNFTGKINDLEIIRENRFIDKILWTIGKNKNLLHNTGA